MLPKQLIGMAFDFVEPSEVFLGRGRGSTRIARIQVHHRIFTSNIPYRIVPTIVWKNTNLW